MLFLAITYHYFGDYKISNHGIHSMPSESFQKQIESLSAHFEFISEDDLLMALDGRRTLPERCCLLTFDDGVKSQYEVAVPVLEKLGVPAIFFVNGAPYRESKVLNIHKIHWLRSILTPDDFLQKVIENFDRAGLGFTFSDDLISDDLISDKFFYDDIATKKIKYLLNVIIPFDNCKIIIDRIFSECVHSEEEFCSDFYIGKDQVKYLYNKFAVGTHSYSHLVLGRHDESVVMRELKCGIEIVEQLVGSRPKGVSYPYGYKEAVTRRVSTLASGEGLSYGFTVERSMNASLFDPLLFARIDCNDALGGKEPLYDFNGEEFLPKQHMTASRTRYFIE